ncbi:MAG: GntR family transcriptional regulator [Planctomycetota bacterium]|nr:GntR family transcriptional regulator [Planctomycetota bacterium]
MRKRILSGSIPMGEFLPSVRHLSEEHGISRETVRRAMKLLEEESLIESVPRRGYRVLARANDPDKGGLLAYVARTMDGREFTDDFHQVLLVEFERLAAKWDWPLLVILTMGRSAEEIAEHIRSARVFGVILDEPDGDLLERFRRFGLPAVLIDAREAAVPIDSVVQDGFIGGVLAARHLVESGHRRIGWIGPEERGLQILERWAGAVGALEEAGVEIPPELRVHTPLYDADVALARARDILGRPDRPTAVLALWQSMTRAVARAAREIGLVPGRDFDMVGWSPEEHYRSAYLPEFGEGCAPPAITWSIARMASAAMTCLKVRRSDPRAQTMHIRIPVRLAVPADFAPSAADPGK